MQYSVRDISNNRYNFYITGVSYAGNPRNNTMMYISKKVEYLINKIVDVNECLVFVEKGISISGNLEKNNCIIFSENPQLEYAKYAEGFAISNRQEDMQLGYRITDEGYCIGNKAIIGANSYIEPGVMIGNDVIIGDNATILAGAVIKHATIGDNFVCNENAVIGNNSFTMAEDEYKNKYRIPALGRVIIRNNVEVGACDNIAVGTCGDTILDDYVKLDALVYVGHEVHLHKNTEITAGVIVAGFAEIGDYSYIGLNSSIRNRICLGANCVVGMGANVTKGVCDNLTVVGNPAKPF